MFTQENKKEIVGELYAGGEGGRSWKSNSHFFLVKMGYF